MKPHIHFPKGGLVEQVTRSTATRADWLKVRGTGLGGTDVAAVAGVNPWRTRLDVYLNKTQKIAFDEPNNGEFLSEAAYWGTQLEAMVATEWARRHGRRIQRIGLLRDALHPHRLASVDRVVLVPGTRRAGSLYEGKTAGLRREPEWTAGIWGDFGRLPPEYLCQVQWYLGITGLDLCHVACLLGGQRLIEVSVPFDTDIYTALCADADEFWKTHVEPQVPPAATVKDLPRLARLFPDIVDDPVELDDQAAKAATLYAHDKSTIRQLEKDLADLELELKTALGGHTTGLVDGTPIVTWRPQPTRRFDTKTFKLEHPDLAAKYETTHTIRVLRVKTPTTEETEYPA